MKKTLFLCGLLLVSSFAFTQVTIPPSGISTSENYVFSRTYLDATTTSNTSTKQIQSVTYFDGLGRPKQSVTIKASPTGKDLVTTIPYDEFGRQVDSWLPAPMNSLSGGIQSGVDGAATGFYDDTNPFSHKVLESSPLDRIQQQIQVGQDWSSEPVKFDYETNVGDGVINFTTTVTPWTNNATNCNLLKGSNYPDATLYKNKITDEDGNVSIEFKNGQGQTLLVRKNDGIEYADTYYVYNEYNQLAFVLSPLASKFFNAQPDGTSFDTDLDPIVNNLCYQYRYDGKNRLVEKKLPGKGWEYMVYDIADRLVLTQDANMQTLGKWMLTKYDQFGRVAYTGTISGGSRLNMQTQIAGGTVTESRDDSTGFSRNGITVYYTNNVFHSLDTVLSVNYYDSYPSGTPYPSGDKIRGVDILKDTFSSGVNVSTKSLPTVSFVKNIENDSWTKNYTFYDRKGRSIGSHSTNHLGGYTKTELELDFTGTPQKTFTYHKRKNTDIVLQVNERFEFNQYNNALQKHYHEVVGNTREELLTENTYNEIGQLTKKKVGNNIQEIDYSYNIRGWMTGINLDLSGNPEVGKLFNYKIKYNNPDPTSPVVGKFNGNIAEIDWWNNGSAAKRYSYQYDGLNRLLNGIYNDPGATIPTNINSESIEYDLNGNITHLYRNAKHSNSYTPIQIDDLTYHYENGLGNSNKLQRIADDSNNQSGYPGGGQTITYDLNGNMTAMPDKGITQPIAYNFLNLPTQIIQNTNTTNYLYRADGVKLRKTYNLINGLGSKIINTEYLDGFQYSTPNTEPIRKALEQKDDITVSATKAGNEEAFLPLEDRKMMPDRPSLPLTLSFFPTAEGYYDYENFRYIYQYKDHLGNVRVSFVKNSAGVLEIMDSNDYYPFGLNHLKGASLTGSSTFDLMAIPYNYKYNGKELQETGMYDYGARMYMPDIGRWGGVDPLAETSRRWSPYTYAYNNPIRFIDPDGMQNEDWIKKENKWTYDANITTVGQARAAGADAFAENGSVISNASIDGGEAGYVRLNEGGTAENMPDNASSALVNFSHETLGTMVHNTNRQTFYNFSGGTNTPNTADNVNKLGDNVERSDLLEWLSYGRSSTPKGSDGAFQFGSDLLGLGDFLSKKGKKGRDTTVAATFMFRTEIKDGYAVGIDTTMQFTTPWRHPSNYSGSIGNGYDMFNPNLRKKMDSIYKANNK